jgi:heterodisulfide reductase subunit B
MALTAKKLKDAHDAGAAYLCVACPYCQIQFDTVQGGMPSKQGANHTLPSLLYPQLLGLCMGIDRKALGLETDQFPLQGIEGFLARGRKGRGARQPEDRGEGLQEET